MWMQEFAWPGGPVQTSSLSERPSQTPNCCRGCSRARGSGSRAGSQDGPRAGCSPRRAAGGASPGSPARGGMDQGRAPLLALRTPGMSHPGSTGAGGARPVAGPLDPSLALVTALGTRRRTRGGHPTTVPRHPLGMTETSKDLRRTRGGHPTTVPRHPLGMTETSKDLRTALERAGTRSCPQSPGLNSPRRSSPPPWPPAGPPRIRGAFRGHRPPWSCPPPGWETRPAAPQEPPPAADPGSPGVVSPAPPRVQAALKASPALSKRSKPAAGKELQPPDPPQPLLPLRGAAERPEQTQDVPVEGLPPGNVLEPPSPAGSPPESPAADAGAVTPVELEAGQTPVGSQHQDPCALGTDPAPPGERSARIQEHLEVEPCTPAVPKAGTGDGSHPQSPAAPPDPAKRELLESSSSGEAGAELSPHCWEQQPAGAGEAEAAAAQGGPLQSLQPPENPQVPPGAAAEPEAQPSRASPAACTTPETSPGPQDPPGCGEAKPAVSGRHQLCSTLPTPFPAGIDFRSAAVLARKAEIELSYQQFSLTIAVVATMLLQKEPSMEAALGLALRATLRQRRIHHLQELEDFIDSYDSATASL
ncbi:basic proline-rich protein-like [Corvus cornix cornix]|uniref:basic proline-rich protein-like n=1 Tax=Corvus cornix cornix TaxID=932674 RepID=UPI00194DF5DC|nr:basic proline-rich protein-like [Corvus cornix cornix]